MDVGFLDRIAICILDDDDCTANPVGRVRRATHLEYLFRRYLRLLGRCAGLVLGQSQAECGTDDEGGDQKFAHLFLNSLLENNLLLWAYVNLATSSVVRACDAPVAFAASA